MELACRIFGMLNLFFSSSQISFCGDEISLHVELQSSRLSRTDVTLINPVHGLGWSVFILLLVGSN